MEMIFILVLSLLLSVLLKLFCDHGKGKRKNCREAPQPRGVWPLIGHLHLLWGREPLFRKLAAMAERYGAVFSLKIGHHRVIVVSGREEVRDCLTLNDRVLATRPNIAAGRYLGYDNAIFALAPYGPYWRDMRKLAALELFSNQRLEQLNPIRASEVESFTTNLMSLIQGNNGAELAIDRLFEHLTFNINLRTIVGKRFSELEFSDVGSDAWRFKKAIQRTTYLAGVFVVSDAIPWLEFLDLDGHLRSMKETAKELDFVLKKWLLEHVEKMELEKEIGVEELGQEEIDFMEIMLEKLPKENETIHGHDRDTVIKATALILLFTGTESTALTMIWTLALLLNNRCSLKHVQEELDTTIGRDRWVQESDIQNLKYLQAVVKETLRLYPPAPLTGLREAMEDCQIGCYDLPKGTRLLVNLWKLQRDPETWPEPDKFVPERFLKEHEKVEAKGSQNFEYIPFSSGRRSCPGATFGIQVVHLVLARVLQGFDVSTAENRLVDMSEGQGIALPKASPLKVVLKPRLSNMELYNYEITETPYQVKSNY